MSISSNPDGSYTIKARTPGPEAAAFGIGFAPDLNADGIFSGVEGGLEVTSGGLLSYSIYTAVMVTLETLEAVRDGKMTRGEQREIVLNRTWQVTKGAVPTVVILAAVIVICPWLAPVAGIAGLIGGGVMLARLVRTAWDAMPQEQRDAIQSKANEVEVSLPGLDDKPATTRN